MTDSAILLAFIIVGTIVGIFIGKLILSWLFSINEVIKEIRNTNKNIVELHKTLKQCLKQNSESK